MWPKKLVVRLVLKEAKSGPAAAAPPIPEPLQSANRPGSIRCRTRFFRDLGPGCGSFRAGCIVMDGVNIDIDRDRDD